MTSMSARIPPGQRVYAVGDIHGRYDLLETLHAAIAADAGDASALAKTIVYLGDYVDRGGQVYEVIDALASGAADGWDRVCLKGNHEDMMLGFLAGTHPLDVWLMNGGDATLAAYGADLADAGRTRAWAFAAGAGGPAEEAGATLAAALPPTHAAFLDALPLHHRCGDYLFVHAGIRPGLPLEEQDPQDLMWIRETFLGSDADHGAVVVHGHTIFNEVDIRPNRIGVDTGAWRSGRLSCIVLEGDEVRVIQT